MPVIKFTTNWNNKLCCSAYSTIRMRNDEKYIVGNEYAIWLKEKRIHTAVIKTINHFTLPRINNPIALLDTGYELHEFKKIITTMYKKRSINWETQQLSMLILQQLKEKPGNLFDKATGKQDVPVNDKIGLFCKYYKEAYKITYKVNKRDTGALKNFDVTQELMHVYFNSDNWQFKKGSCNHSIKHYQTHYNAVRALAFGEKAPVKSAYPDTWKPGYARGLSPVELQGYYKHLREDMGLKAKKDGLGRVTDWVHPELIND